MRLIDSLSATLVLCFAAAACGAPAATPAAPSSTPSSTATPSASAAPTGDAVPSVWSDSMPKETKAAFMKTKVAPRMGKVFQAANASRYADFGCKTCHGPEYKDPKDHLPHLTMKDGNITAFAEKPQIAKFMAEHVVPDMASAMGLPPYDPTTHKGFGCGGCHAIDMK